jgi:hypothetical protein
LKRVLVTISFSFSIRYIVRTGLLEKLRFFCIPVVAITWKQQDLIEELQAMGFEVHLVPEAKTSPAYRDIRRKIDICFDEYMLRSQSKKIQARYLNQYRSARGVMLSKLRVLYNKGRYCFTRSREQLFKAEEQLVVSDTNWSVYENFIQGVNIDAVFTVTPFHKQEDILLRVCKYKGKKMLASILSFDNITKRGWIPVAYDVYAVWNQHNKNQLHRIYPYTKSLPVHITGAAQFDFYFNIKKLLPFEQWKEIMGISASGDRKIILYAGGPESLFPDEPQYLKHLDEAINEHKIKNDPVILFRCHPIDHIERWKNVAGNSSNIVFDSSWTGTDNIHNANITDHDIQKLCSTLAYTDVHISLCSTMTVDGSAFQKPQIGPAYNEAHLSKEHLLRQMYFQEHFIPVIQTGGLQLAESKQQLVEYVNKALEQPEAFTKNAGKILQQIITYTDGRSTARVAEIIKNFLIREA